MSNATWRMFCLILLAAFLLRGIAIACIIPPMEMWDEYQHVGYIEYLIENHRMPIYGPAMVPRSVVQQVVRFPAGPSAVRQLGASGAIGYPPFWKKFPHRPTFNQAARDLPLYEAQHPPLYYWLAIPIFQAAGGAKHLEHSVATLRLVNLSLECIALALLLTWLGRACCDRREAMLLALWPAFQPLFLLNSVRVSNDALAVMIGIAAVAALMRLVNRPSWQGRRFVWHCAGIGLLLGLGVLVKATDFALLPFAAICLIVIAFRRRTPPRMLLLGTAAMAAVLLALTGWYYAFNLHHYHMLMPVQQGVENQKNHVGLRDYLSWIAHHPWRLWPGLWYRWLVIDGLWFGGWSFVRLGPMFARLYVIGLAAAAPGWLLAWLFRRERLGSENPQSVFRDATIVPLALLLTVIVFCGLSVHALEALVAWGGDGTWPWYAEVATPWMLIAIAAGAIGWRNSRLGYGVGLIVPLACIAAEWTGSGLRMVELYAQLPIGIPALRRLSLLQPPWLGTSTLLACAAGAAILTAIALVACTRVLWKAYRARRGADGMETYSAAGAPCASGSLASSSAMV